MLDPHPAFILPFALLLLCIACGPLFAARLWEHHYQKVAVGLGAISAGYYLFGLHAPGRLLHAAGEYLSFIIFIAALFIVAGGIHLRTKGEAKPWVNTAFLFVGALLANVVGTTGASVLLIRPWIRMNKYRFTGHHVAFFIFVVSNVGGCLTPIGDPPLFLGYLKGVPFFWVTQHCAAAWALALALVLGVFYLIDRLNFLRAPKAVREAETAHEEFKLEGRRNLGLLALILGAVVAIPASVPILRELLLAAAAFVSWKTTPRPIHDANHFSFGPIKEVAWLFLGIFATMLPALDHLEHHAHSLGLSQPIHFYWSAGALSSVLDNAPTYLTFLAAACGLHDLSLDRPGDLAQLLAAHPAYVVAVSVGAVFFGAGTYIGNGPNLMVKAICDHHRVHTPSFFIYIVRYSVPILLPIFWVVGRVFF